MINQIADELKEDEGKTEVLKAKLNSYYKEVKENKLSEDFIAEKPSVFNLFFKAIGILIGLPFWIAAKIINFLPEYIIEKKVIAGVKDITWHISLRTGVSLFLYPIYYLIIYIVLGISLNWVLAGIIAFTFPLISVVLYETEYHFKKLKNAFILFKNPKILKQEQELVQEFISLLV